METALADHAVEKLMRGPSDTTAVVSLVCPNRVVGVVNSGSKVSVSSLWHDGLVTDAYMCNAKCVMQLMMHCVDVDASFTTMLWELQMRDNPFGLILSWMLWHCNCNSSSMEACEVWCVPYECRSFLSSQRGAEGNIEALQEAFAVSTAEGCWHKETAAWVVVTVPALLLLPRCLCSLFAEPALATGWCRSIAAFKAVIWRFGPSVLQ